MMKTSILTMMVSKPMHPLLYPPLLVALTLITLNQLMKQNSMLFLPPLLFDKLSLIMLLLTLLTITLILCTTTQISSIYLLMGSSLLILTATFLASTMIIFYLLFELILIPTFVMITQLGKQPERLQASLYLLLYTILTALPLIMLITSTKNNPNMFMNITLSFQTHHALLWIAPFLVKAPMFFMHLWLPKAHVEAPLEGSMILAAVLLKLGGYGMIRMIPLMLKSTSYASPWIMAISMIGATMTSMNCIRQKDLKALIAYSSVSHMGLVITSIVTTSLMGMKGAVLMMLAHGLTSSALFTLVNMLYTNFHSRNIILFKGLITLMPNLTFWWFIFTAANISAPPSINLVSEIMMITAMMSYTPAMGALIVLAALATSSFCVLLFINISHNSPCTPPLQNNTNKMFFCLNLHMSPLILMIMTPTLLMP